MYYNWFHHKTHPCTASLTFVSTLSPWHWRPSFATCRRGVWTTQAAAKPHHQTMWPLKVNVPWHARMYQRLEMEVCVGQAGTGRTREKDFLFCDFKIILFLIISTSHERTGVGSQHIIWMCPMLSIHDWTGLSTRLRRLLWSQITCKSLGNTEISAHKLREDRVKCGNSDWFLLVAMKPFFASCLSWWS